MSFINRADSNTLFAAICDNRIQDTDLAALQVIDVVRKAHKQGHLCVDLSPLSFSFDNEKLLLSSSHGCSLEDMEARQKVGYAPAWCAPEIAKEIKRVSVLSSGQDSKKKPLLNDASQDIWAVGLILHAIFTKGALFRFQALSYTSQQPEAFAQLASLTDKSFKVAIEETIPEKWQKVVSLALNIDPKKRPTAEDLFNMAESVVGATFDPETTGFIQTRSQAAPRYTIFDYSRTDVDLKFSRLQKAVRSISKVFTAPVKSATAPQRNCQEASSIAGLDKQSTMNPGFVLGEKTDPFLGFSGNFT